MHFLKQGSTFQKNKRINLLLYVLLCYLFYIAPFDFSKSSNVIASSDPEEVSNPQKIGIHLSGSLQNPAWGPLGSNEIVFTRYRNGYGKGPADLFIHNLRSNFTRLIMADGFDNVSPTGAAWDARNDRITFSSTRTGIDQIYTIGRDGNRTSPRTTLGRPELCII